MFKGIINQGIDSNLEGFTKSTFEQSPNFNNKFLFNFEKSELPILLRRLEKVGTPEALSWIEDINNSENNLEEDNIPDVKKSRTYDLEKDFNLPTDLEFQPGDEDIRDVEDTWGKGNYVDKPMEDKERNDLYKTITNTGNDEAENFARELDREKNSTPGGFKGKKMSKFGGSIN